MREAVIMFITYLLSVYGLVCLLIMLVQSFNMFSRKRNENVRLVLILKDQEQSVEGIVKTLMSGEYMKKAAIADQLVIIDMGSSDGTLEILEKLRKDYGCIEVVGKEEKDRIFTVFSQEGR